MSWMNVQETKIMVIFQGPYPEVSNILYLYVRSLVHQSSHEVLQGFISPGGLFKNHWEGSGLHEIVCSLSMIHEKLSMTPNWICSPSICDRTLKLRHIHATSSQVMMFHIWLVTLSYPDIRQYAVKIMVSRDAPSATPWLWMKSIRFPWFFFDASKLGVDLPLFLFLHVDMSTTQ